MFGSFLLTVELPRALFGDCSPDSASCRSKLQLALQAEGIPSNSQPSAFLPVQLSAWGIAALVCSLRDSWGGCAQEFLQETLQMANKQPWCELRDQPGPQRGTAESCSPSPFAGGTAWRLVGGWMAGPYFTLERWYFSTP